MSGTVRARPHRGTAGVRAPLGQRVLALLTAGLGAAAMAGAFGLLTTDRKIVVGANTVVNPDAPIDANNSPTAALNPKDPRNIVLGNRVDRPGYTSSLHWSVDGGTSWITTGLPLPEGTEACAAPPGPGELCPFGPDVAFAPDGILYVTYVNLAGRGNTPQNLWVARSSDGGRTLSAPVRVAGQYTFQPRIAVDRDGIVHITWLQAEEVGLLRVVGPAQVVAVRSEDGGKTFTEPVPVSDESRERVGAATPIVDSSGEVVVLYQDFKDDIRDFSNLEGPVWERPFGLVVSRSRDGGKAFSRGIELESNVVPAERFLVFLPIFPSIAAGPDRSLVVAWSDARNGDPDVFLRRSADGGATWTSPARVNDNPRNDGTWQYMPRAAVAANGRVDVVFYDRRRDPDNVKTDAYLATSSREDGAFTNLRISAESFDSRIGPLTGPAFLPPDFGSRLALVSWDDGAFAAWTDTRQGTVDTGRQDVVGARIGLPNVAALARQRLLVVALLIAAAISLAGWRMQSQLAARDRPRVPPAREVPAPGEA